MCCYAWAVRLGRQFGACADVYDRVRPGYPEELFDCLAERLPREAAVVEVGAGTGIATRVMRARGWSVTALEPDPDMAAWLSAEAGQGLTVLGADFEHARLGRAWADAVVAAQAWHWVDRVRGLRKARRVLRQPGLIACWWNVGSIGDTDLAERLHQVFARSTWPVPALIGPAVIDQTIDQLRADLRGDRRFRDPERWTFTFHREYQAEDLVALMSTMSQVLAMATADRTAVLDAMAKEVGGSAVVLRYRTELVLAERR